MTMNGSDNLLARKKIHIQG